MKHPMTPEGYERLNHELQNLIKYDRPSIAQAIAEARAHGDLSENAEYSAAKEKQGFIEARIKHLQAALSSCEVLDPKNLDIHDRVIFGAYVEVLDEDEQLIKIRLVGEYESDPDQGLLSVTSPLGKALIGKNAGDEFEINAPGGEKIYQLQSIALDPWPEK